VVVVANMAVTPLLSSLVHPVWTLDLLIAKGVPTSAAGAKRLRFACRSST